MKIFEEHPEKEYLCFPLGAVNDRIGSLDEELPNPLRREANKLGIEIRVYDHKANKSQFKTHKIPKVVTFKRLK